MTPYRLYARQNSGSLVVQAALEEIGVPYECTWVSVEAAEEPAFRKISPTGKIPALELPDGTVMFESAAILIHLSLAHPGAGLAPPPGTSRHARFLQWMVFLSVNLYQSALRIYYPDRFSTRSEDAAAIREQGTADFLRHMELLSHSLTPYVLGEEFSIADVYLYMLASWYPAGTPALFSTLPALALHAERLSRRSALIKADADHSSL
jgi:glutathione S-transferase